MLACKEIVHNFTYLYRKMKVPSNRLIKNGKLVDTGDLQMTDLILPGSVYEVIRLINNCPLFLTDHVDRLFNSCRNGGKDILADRNEIERCITVLQEKTDVRSINLRISFNYDETGDYYLVHFIDSVYPEQEMYQKGVKTELFRAERNTPTLKIYDTSLREKVSRLLSSTGVFEIILFDRDGKITEGSKSNIFFIKDDTLITAPSDTILPGITRKYVIEISEKLGIRIEYRNVGIDELDSFDSVFLCGTSPMVLPVSLIGQHRFSVQNRIVRMLMNSYNDLVETSLKECH